MNEGGRKARRERHALGRGRGRGTKEARMDRCARVIIQSNKLSRRGKNDDVSLTLGH